MRVRREPAHDELIALNRGIGHLLGEPDLETDANPLAPATIVERVLRSADRREGRGRRIKFQILKELNQASLGDINAIYADLNKHLTQTQHDAAPAEVARHRRGGAGDRAAAKPRARHGHASRRVRRKST